MPGRAKPRNEETGWHDCLPHMAGRHADRRQLRKRKRDTLVGQKHKTTNQRAPTHRHGHAGTLEKHRARKEQAKTEMPTPV